MSVVTLATYGSHVVPIPDQVNYLVQGLTFAQYPHLMPISLETAFFISLSFVTLSISRISSYSMGIMKLGPDS